MSDLQTSDGKTATSLADAVGGAAAAQLSGLRNATYALLACAAIGLVFSILVMLRKGNRWANGAVLIVAGALPLVFATEAVFGVPMVLAGGLAFAVNYAKAPPAPAPQFAARA